MPNDIAQIIYAVEAGRTAIKRQIDQAQEEGDLEDMIGEWTQNIAALDAFLSVLDDRRRSKTPGFNYRIADGGRIRELKWPEDMPTFLLVTREMADRIYELVAARAVLIETQEDANAIGLNSTMWRVPANALREQIYGGRPRYGTAT